MTICLARRCPMCGNYLAVIIAGREVGKVQPVCGACAACGYRIEWALIRS